MKSKCGKWVTGYTHCPLLGLARISQLLGFGEGGIGIRVGTTAQDL